MTEHALKFQLDRFTLTPVRVRQKSYSKTDGHTNTHKDGFFKITFLDVLLIIHPKSGLIENSIYLYDANTSMGHGSKTDKSCRCSPSEQTAGIVRVKETIVLWWRQKSPPPNHHLSFAWVRCWVHYRAEFSSEQRFWYGLWERTARTQMTWLCARKLWLRSGFSEKKTGCNAHKECFSRKITLTSDLSNFFDGIPWYTPVIPVPDAQPWEGRTDNYKILKIEWFKGTEDSKLWSPFGDIIFCPVLLRLPQCETQDRTQ